MHGSRSLHALAFIAGVTLAAGCSTHDASNGASAHDSTAAPATANASPASPDTIVRGTITNLSDSTLTLTTSTGPVNVAITQPVRVYTRQPGDLSRVTDHSFVGVTSVPQPDGSQRATEIHVFPEELRGLGEGSRPMAPQSNAPRSTMTNGSVASSRMTNGAARMTNGTSAGAAGGTMTVQYNGGSQTITVPAGVSVTVIAPTSTKLAAGADVVVPGSKLPGGGIRASLVMLAGSPQPAR